MSRASHIPHSDQGQTIPLFIVAVMALLFLAFVLFAVGQAAVHRNSTQSAADAAALAAAQQARDELEDELLGALLDSDLAAITEIFESQDIGAPQACAQARRFAARNEADVTLCAPVTGPPGYRVSVISQEPLGDSQVEGTENKFATSRATAVIEPRCSLREDSAEPAPDPEPTKERPPPEDVEPPVDERPDPPSPIAFDCDGGFLSIDPGDLDLEIDMAEFFSVYLRD